MGFGSENSGSVAFNEVVAQQNAPLSKM